MKARCKHICRVCGEVIHAGQDVKRIMFGGMRHEECEFKGMVKAKKEIQRRLKKETENE